MATLPLISGKSEATNNEVEIKLPDDITAVHLRPLNFPNDNLFAAHRSHSSHGSHRSSSGGGYSAPSPTKAPPSNSDSPGNSLYGTPNSNRPVDPGRAATVSPSPTHKTPPSMTRSEKLTLQIMRVQISLSSLGIYGGSINGELDSATKESLRRFQIVKGIEPDGLMSTETLNALGVPAVQ